MVKHIATPRRRFVVALVTALTAALATSGCGVKGPLVPAPRPAAPSPSQVPPPTSDAAPSPPQTSAPTSDVPPAERKP